MPIGHAGSQALFAEIDNPGGGPRLVLVHGFTQNRGCWGKVATDLAEDHEVVRVDAPGHGRSGHATAGLREGAALIGAAGGPATYVGYSMGGRYCLQLALARPDLVEALAVVGASAGIEDASAREARAAEDEQRAARLESIGLEAFLDEWLAMPLFAGLSDAQAHRSARLENDAAALAASLRHAGTGHQQPLWARLGELAMPVLVVTGELDDTYRELSARIVRTIGANASLAVVAGSGHAPQLDRPYEFLAALRRWLDQITR